MKTCPVCGADYVEAVVNDITAGVEADPSLMLASLEEGLAGLDTVPMPAPGETVRKMMPLLCGVALAFCLLSGVLTGANFFYLLAIVALILLVAALMRGRQRLSAGEVVPCRAGRGPCPEPQKGDAGCGRRAGPLQCGRRRAGRAEPCRPQGRGGLCRAARMDQAAGWLPRIGRR